MSLVVMPKALLAIGLTICLNLHSTVFSQVSARQQSSDASLLSSSQQVARAFQQLEAEYISQNRHAGDKFTVDLVEPKLLKILSNMIDPDTVGLFAVDAIATRHFAGTSNKSQVDWQSLGTLIYANCLEKLSKNSSETGKNALRKIAECLRGDEFHTATSMAWIKAVMIQNGEQMTMERTNWYIEHAFMAQFKGTHLLEIEQNLKLQKDDFAKGVKMPENMVAP